MATISLVDPHLRALAVALFLGLLIGLERGWRQRTEPDGQRVSGFRTFGLLGLAGGVAGLVPVAVAAVIALAAGATLVIGYRTALARGEPLSATTTIAALLTFALGYVATLGMAQAALAGAAVTLIVLASRTELHGLLKGMNEAEVESVARFAIVALVILPLLPDAQYGPYGALNPHRIWLVVVVVLALSFAGYVAARRFGAERGILLTAATGALVSSTAVTLSYARRLRASDDEEGALIAGIALASLVMVARVQVVTAILAPRASASLAVALLPALLVSAGFAAWAYRQRADGDQHAVSLGNPFDFGPALLLAALVAVLSVVARWAIAHFGDQGVALLLGLTGMVDVDAAVLTLASFDPHAIDGWTAGLVLAVPVLVNTLVKAVSALTIAGGAKGVRASASLFAAVLASGLGIGLATWLR